MVEFNDKDIYLLERTEATKYPVSKTEIGIAKLKILKEYIGYLEKYLDDNMTLPKDKIAMEVFNTAKDVYDEKYKDSIENYSKYKIEFIAEDFNIPDFLLSKDWRDESWHNDSCPCFVNYKLGLAVWVSEIELDLRELALCQYTVVEVQKTEEGEDNEREFLDPVCEVETAIELLTFINEWENTHG